MKPIAFANLRTACLTLAAGLTVITACNARGGGGDVPRRESSLTLIPGDGANARHEAGLTLSNADGGTEIRRANPVLDPNDPTRLSTGSLWKEGVTNEVGMFADRRARQRGDILTLVVAENTTITNTLDQQTSKANSVNSVLDQFVLRLPKKLPLIRPTAPVTPDAALGLTATYAGNAQLNQQQSLTASAAVTVTDVLPNGNLVLEGTRIVTFAGETKYIEMSGIVRGDDVAPDNTVQSANVANAKVRFLSEGSLTNAQKKGWLSRAIDRFNPL